MRYKSAGNWTEVERAGRFSIEESDAIDTKNGSTYRDGARRVLVDGKPVRGKGGTTPFWGEMAWADSERLFHDLIFNERRTA